MTSLVACIGEGKGTWAHVSELVKKESWENVFIVTNDFGRQNFKPEKPVEFVVVNEDSGLEEMIEKVRKVVDGRIFGEVAVNLISGSGKMHMAVISGLIRAGAGIRFVALTKEGVKEF